MKGILSKFRGVNSRTLSSNLIRENKTYYLIVQPFTKLYTNHNHSHHYMGEKNPTPVEFIFYYILKL